MNFDFTPEQEALRDSVRRFFTRGYAWETRMAIVHGKVAARHSHWPILAELGLLGAGLSEEAGGYGGGPVETALIAEEFGRGLVLEPFAAHVASTELLAAIGAGPAAELLGTLVSGEQRAAFAANEAGGVAIVGDSTGALRLSGILTYVEGALDADILLVVATDRIIQVATNASGVSLTPYRTIDNHVAADIGFDNVLLEPVAILAEGAIVAAALERAKDGAVLALCGEALGVMDAALWLTRDYVRTRKQFGATLGSFQAVQHRMADMLIETELARSILMQAIAAFSSEDADLRCRGLSAAKAQMAESGMRVLQSAIQLHGGMGMTEEYAIGHYYKRIYVIARQGGDADLHLARFAAATDRLIAAGHRL